MITIVNPEKYCAGLYERLSREERQNFATGGLHGDVNEKESGSISTQKMFLKNFCDEKGLKIYRDYVDDGYSGATFDRPAFAEMLKDIEEQKINLVICKDLSRFGRAAGQISYYLEEFFVEKKVRFIAVSDMIDTGEQQASNEEMMQFKAFFNEWFLRDTSKKVRNGKKARAKARQGYGHLRDLWLQKGPFGQEPLHRGRCRFPYSQEDFRACTHAARHQAKSLEFCRTKKSWCPARLSEIPTCAMPRTPTAGTKTRLHES